MASSHESRQGLQQHLFPRGETTTER
jgi:hypothetical protein